MGTWEHLERGKGRERFLSYNHRNEIKKNPAIWNRWMDGWAKDKQIVEGLVFFFLFQTDIDSLLTEHLRLIDMDVPKTSEAEAMTPKHRAAHKG